MRNEFKSVFGKGNNHHNKDESDSGDEIETRDDKKTVFRPISLTNNKSDLTTSRMYIPSSAEKAAEQLPIRKSRSDSPNKISFLGQKSPSRVFKLVKKTLAEGVTPVGSPNSSFTQEEEKAVSANAADKQLPVSASPMVSIPSRFLPKTEIQLRSSEQDPSRYQMSIPEPSDVLFPAKLCHLLGMYRRVDQNFDFSTLIGMTRLSMATFAGRDSKSKKSSPSFLAAAPSAVANKGGEVRPPSLLNGIMQTTPGTPIKQNRPVRNVLLTDTHKPILSYLLDCQDDAVVEGFYHEVWGGNDPSKSTTAHNNNTCPSYDSATKQKPAIDRTEVAIFQSDYHRKFTVVYQGSAESQTKPMQKKELKTPLNPRCNPQIFSKEQPVYVFPPFRKAYFPVTERDLESKVFDKLDELAEMHPFFDVVMTGHSFGATLALLASMRYACSRPTLFVSCIAFGCPKIGALNFRHYVNSLPNLKVMRFEYGSDPWVNTPENPAWVHAGHAIVIDSQTSRGGTVSSGKSGLVDNASSTNVKTDKASSQSQQQPQAVRAYKFGDRPTTSQAASSKFMGGLLSRQFSNRQERAKGTRQERQLDHDILRYIRAVEQATQRDITLWPRHFVGEEGAGVNGSDKEKRRMV